MLQTLKRPLLERVRCTKHNVLDRRRFKVYYKRGIYSVHTADGVTLRFPHNPYLAFFEIEGYLAHGAWTIEPDMYVVDAGAFRGEFGLYAAARVGPRGRVFMLEPDPTNLKLLNAVFALNGGRPANVVVLGQGLAAAPGLLQFAAGLGASSTLNAPPGSHLADAEHPEQASSANSITIEVQSLASLVDSYHMARLDFVKMDIEGAEVEVVQSAGSVLSRFKPRFAVASYHTRAGKPTAETLELLFAEAGYYARTGFPPHLTTYASATPLPMR